MKKEEFDSMIVFTEPVNLKGHGLCYGIAFTLGHRDIYELARNIESYIQYLTSLIKWYDEGGSLDDSDLDLWYDKDGNTYRYDEDYISEYKKRAYKEKPIRYNVIFGNQKFEDKFLDGQFIISAI